MADEDFAATVADVVDTDPEAFRESVARDAEFIKDELRDGAFDNAQAMLGLEYEFYAVRDPSVESESHGDGDDRAPYLRRVPRRLLELIGFEKELGLHNAEMTVSPQPMNEHGLVAQESEVKARLSAAMDCTRSEGMRLVSDGMWTVPPEGETARGYLTDSVEQSGVRIATNMSDAERYHAMANTDAEAEAGMRLDAPHVSLSADTVMPESLITSIQPHYQVPHAPDLPEYFTYALRVAAPLLALGVNSPFFPPDLYDDAPAAEILADAWMENRISVFETTLNAEHGTYGKVRFPRDIETVEQAVDRIRDDDSLVPIPPSRGDRFDDGFAHFRLKHGTYWRWVRPVFDGPSRSAANARIEFRPVPAQPTVRDVVAFLAAYAGLLESLRSVEHPVAELDWVVARDNFYAAMRDGLDADLTWITNDGKETTDAEELYADLLAHAEDGLSSRGLSDEEAAKYIWPLRQRVRHGLTPARWKRDVVATELDDGASLAGAITEMQRRYVERQRETLLTGSFADWVDEH